MDTITLDQVALIFGPGQYLVNVAGESYYPESFAKLCGPRRLLGVRLETRARLTLQEDNEHDKYAVSVTVQGFQVGHLPRELARAFRRHVRYGELSKYETFECAALICGGWDRGDNDVGDFDIRLDLLLDD